MIKVCFKCGESKPCAEFYVHPKMADGYLGKCKACTKADIRRHRITNLERVRAYDKGRSGTPSRVATRSVAGKAWKARFPERARVQRQTKRLIDAGVLVRPASCQACGAAGHIEAHHDDYAQPDQVEFLCKPCHWKADHERRSFEALGAF